jgi:hypothetical protein
LVVIHDLKGTGHGAECSAIVDGNGRVVDFRVPKGKEGQDYSESVVVGLYTDQAVIPEVSIPNRDSLRAPAWGEFPFTFSRAFGDTRARHLNFVGQVHTRFRQEVREGAEEPLTTRPRRLELVSSARPPKPEIAYLLPAYSSNRTFEKRAGRLIEQRDAVIRCYVQRPWNASGDERLGVVVYDAQINTSRILEDADHEGLIPAQLRKYVSRWGFDPVWDDNGYAPLTVDDFTKAVDVARYDDIVELSGTESPPASVALYEVRYSAKKDLWYADIALRAPEQGMPFVQLALVRYQPNGLAGFSMSEVALADPIVHPGHRRLTVSRSNADSLRFDVSGNFDGRLPRGDKRPAGLPRRKVVVELRKILVGLPREIEGPLAYDDEQTDRRSLDRWELHRAADCKRFSGKISLGSWITDRPQDYYLAVKEFEVFQSAASHRDRTGSTGVIFDQGLNPPSPAFERLVYYRALELTDLP